jgi:ATP-dependent Clp protease, protease subunit
MSLTSLSPVPAPNLYAVFSGEINQDSTKRFFKAISAATAKNVRHIHVLMESYGGFVGDGICLYNFFKSLPVDLTLYNAGAVQSIATIAYLGAKYRKASARAAFMIHRTLVSPQLANSAKLHAVAKSITIDDERTESILREHLQLSKEEWDALNYTDLHFSGAESLNIGLVQEIGEFAPPSGSQLWDI